MLTLSMMSYLPKPHNDIISSLVAICINRILSPVLNIDLSKTTQEILKKQIYTAMKPRAVIESRHSDCNKKLLAILKRHSYTFTAQITK